MASQHSGPDILSYLQHGSGCSYLSDLHDTVCYKQIKDFIRTCDMSLYSLADWNYAYSYILNAHEDFSATSELRTSFLHNLI